MNQTKLQALLQTDDVLRTDSVRAPEGFVKVFAVPTTEFSRAVINVIKRPTAFEYTLDLPELADIAARVKRHFDVSAQAEANLIGLMWQVAGHDRSEEHTSELQSTS